MNPQRIQRQRTRGWRMPEGAVAVSRPTRWGNPFRAVRAPRSALWEVRYGLAPGDSTWVGDRDSKIDAQAASVGMFATALRDGALLITPDDVRRELAGRDLACWCSVDLPCHGDILLEVAANPRRGPG